MLEEIKTEELISVEDAQKKEEKKKGLIYQAGMSFLEIMIVIVIMAGLAAMVGPMLFSRLDEANADQAKIQMKSLESALELYRLDNNSYPTTEQGLEALVKKPELGKTDNWNGPYLKGKLPEDPWGNAYIYLQESSRSFNITTLGADGEEGGEGVDADISLN